MGHPFGDGRVGHRMTHKLGWPTCRRQRVEGGVGRHPEAERAEGSPVNNRSDAAEEDLAD
jgi:hypothetical protein